MIEARCLACGKSRRELRFDGGSHGARFSTAYAYPSSHCRDCLYQEEEMTGPTIKNVKAVSARLLMALVILMGVLVLLFLIFLFTEQVVTLPIVLIFGAIGAFISLQRRLKQLSEKDLS